MKKFIPVCILCFFAFSVLTAQKAPIVGTVNFQRLLNDYVAYQVALKQMEDAEQVARKEVEKLKKKLGLVEVELRIEQLSQKASNPAIADEERKAAEAEGQQLLKENTAKIQQFSAFGRQLQQKNERARLRELNPFQLKAREAVIAVAKDKGIEMVVPIVPRELKVQDAIGAETTYSVFDGQILYASDNLEITGAVIAVLNAQ